MLDKEHHVVKVMEASNYRSNIATKNGGAETRASIILESAKKQHIHKPLQNPAFMNKGIVPYNISVAPGTRCSRTHNQTNFLPSWSRYSHGKQNLTKTQDSSNDTPIPTPRAKTEEHCINGSSVNLNTRNNLHHPHGDIKQKLENTKFNPLLDLGGGLKDLRFKNLESVLIPH